LTTFTFELYSRHLGTRGARKSKAGVNFINVVSERFSYESKLSSFSLVKFGFVIFGAKTLDKNARIKR
jgi:hypothetical protein